MTQQAPRPTQTPTASAPAARAATPSTKPNASPSHATGARPFAVSTSRVLSLSRLIAALACLIAGAVGAWVLNSTSASLGEINRGTQQMLRLQQIKGDIYNADALATSGLALGTPAASVTAYNDALTQAAQLTVEASQAQPLDQAELTSVNAGIISYVLTMERARTAYPRDNADGITYVDQASTALTKTTVPALDRLIAANSSRVDAARASDRLWAGGVALVSVLLLVGIGILLARRTRRILNVGLLVALAASLVLWRLVDTNLAAAAGVVDTARAGSLRTATAAATAYSTLAEAKSIEGHEMLQPSRISQLEPTWTAAMTEATTAVDTIGSAGSTISKNVDAYETAHTALVALLKAGKTYDAKASAASTTTGVTPTYAAASQGLSSTFAEATTATASDMTAQQGGLGVAFWLALVFGLMGAVASWIGISARMREFR